MIATRNKNSGKYFIVIQYLFNRKLLCVTPECKIRDLEKNLFVDELDEDEDILITYGFLTEDQVKKYHNYKSNREDENYFDIRLTVEDMTPLERKSLLEELKAL